MSPAGLVPDQIDAARLGELVGAFLATHDHTSMDRLEFLRARFDAGLAWVHFPVGLGGLGAPRALQPAVDAAFAEAAAAGHKLRPLPPVPGQSPRPLLPPRPDRST